MRHVRKQYNRWSFRLSVLGKYVDAGESYPDETSAGVAADLAKHYLAREFKFVLPCSLDGEQFSSLAYSRRNVDLSDSQSVLKSLPPGVLEFIETNSAALEAHRDAAPPESTASKFRRSEMIDLPGIREWVEKLESAEWQAQSFSAINGQYFFSLLDSMSNRLTDVLKPLNLAVKMHADVTEPLLVQRREKLSLLAAHMQLNLSYVQELTAELRAEQAGVEGAVTNLEAARPSLG